MGINLKNYFRYYRILGYRGLFAVLKSLLKKAQILLKVKRSDMGIPVYLRVPSSDVEVYKQVFIDQEYNFQASKDIKTIIDAGANIGLTSVYFARKFPDTKIYAIEPEEENFRILKKNITGYNNITPIKCAIWNENANINLIDAGLGSWGFMTQKKNNNKCKTGQLHHIVQGMTIDQIMQEQGMEEVDILKIDIEGAEMEVFNDPSLWINKVNCIIIELHDHMKSGCSRSFYNNTNDFDEEWVQGDSVFIVRNNGCIKKPEKELLS